MDAKNDEARDLSVVLITLNEERHLPACLRSLPRGAEVIVLDSGSTDKTLEIARLAGARVEQRPFDNHAAQKNAAISLATRPWVFSVDADEVVGNALRASLILTTGTSNSPKVAYRVRRRLVFMGRALRFGKATDHPVRLFRNGQAHFVSEIHERLEIAGATGYLAGELAHHSYDDLSDYFRRFNDYTSKVAENHYRQGHTMPPGALHVLRPWSEFIVRYFVRLGFLDGYPGYTYALLSSVYTYVKYAKLRERLVTKVDVS